MDKQQLEEARRNPDFLKYLEQTRVDAIETKNISALYEVLDSFLILDLDEEKINEIYQNILQISFENIEEIIKKRKLKLEDDDLYFIRAFYEHAIERWSYENKQGAKELFFVLSNIVDDEKLSNSLKSHIIALSKDTDLDTFYSKEVDLSNSNDDEKYGYFITKFNYDLEEYLKNNINILEKEYKELKHLLGN